MNGPNGTNGTNDMTGTPSTDQPSAGETTASPEASATPESEGATSEATAPSRTDTAATAVARAEDVLDTVGQRLGSWATSLEHGLRVLGARAREEAEDMLAEAQAIRAGNEHQQTAHAHVVPTPRIERIDEVPPDQSPSDQSSGTAAAPTDTGTATGAATDAESSRAESFGAESSSTAPYASANGVEMP